MPLTATDLRTALLSAPPLRRDLITLPSGDEVAVREPTFRERNTIYAACTSTAKDGATVDTAKLQRLALLRLTITTDGAALFSDADAAAIDDLPASSPLIAVVAPRAVEMLTGAGRVADKGNAPTPPASSAA